MITAADGRIIADTQIKALDLRPVIRGYELAFRLELAMRPAGTGPHEVWILGAQVGVRGGGTRTQRCGFARPECVARWRQRDFPQSSTAILVLPMQPGQIAALEDVRGAGDLEFELTLAGRVSGAGQHIDIGVTLRHREARSDWIERLRNTGASDVLLIEVPMPLGDSSGQWDDVEAQLRRAEAQFRHGDYQGCVASCRTVVQEAGHLKYTHKRWSDRFLSRLANDRESMTREERERAMWSAVRHYTHQAHHAPGEGGVARYSRTEAQRVLVLAAVAAESIRTG